MVDEDPDALFKQLRAGSMMFEPLPDPEEEPADEKTPEFEIALERAKRTDNEYLKAVAALGETEADEEKADEIDRRLTARVRAKLGLPKLHVAGKLDIAGFARAHGFDPSFDLPCTPSQAATHLTDNKIRVLHTKSRFEARLRTIADRARSDAAEYGIHTLHMAFGFIEWPEDDASAVLHHAPLLLMPVALSRKHVRGHYVYRLSGADEELAVNFALVELLRQKFAVELPKVTSEETPNGFFDKVEAILAAIPRLCLRRFVTIAIVRFHGMALWRDLDVEGWPEGTILNHDKLALLLGARGNDHDERTFPQDYSIEDEPFEAKAPVLILPADVSQHSALVDALSGHSLAVEGPPGTGKSQTIANLIAAALDAGKKVLFCAEKRAALDVVAKRLEERGFGPLMLELHSDRASKPEIVSQGVV